MSKAESEAILRKLLDRLQGSRRVRMAIATLFVGVLLFIAGRSVYNLIPKHYALTISGGDIVSNRHFLARLVQAEAPRKNVKIAIHPVEGAIVELEDVSSGKLDLALVPGGIDAHYPNIEHVATLMPELVHLLAKPGIKGLDDLKGKTLNLGSRQSASREISLKILDFAEYVENVDYVETNYTDEELIALPKHKMPDALFTVSSAPSYLVELLVRKEGYQVLPIAFPESLALRYGWAANGQILAYTYDLVPPVPERTIPTVSVNMHLVANKGADPDAIAKLLEVVYNPAVEGRLRQPLDEKRIGLSSGYPYSLGMTRYLERDKSILTLENWNKAVSTFGLIMSFSGMGIVVAKWFKGAPPKPVFHDKEFHAYLEQVVEIEKRAADMEAGGAFDIAALKEMRAKLNRLRGEVLERYAKVTLKDTFLFEHCINAVRATHEHVGALLDKAERLELEKAVTIDA